MADLLLIDSALGQQVISDKDPRGINLDFGQIVAGNISNVREIGLVSNIAVSNPVLWIESVQQGDIVEISKFNNPFIPSQQVSFDGIYTPNPTNIALMSFGGSVSASSYYGANIPSNAFDGNTNTIWTASSKDAWITRDLGSKQPVNSFRFFTKGTASTSKTYYLQGSNDNINWNYIVNTKTFTEDGTLKWHEELFPIVCYRYYKCSFSSSGDWITMNEIELIASFVYIGTFYVRVKPGESSSGPKSFRVKISAIPV